MEALWNSLLCFIGLHDWEESHPLVDPTVHPHSNPTRTCQRCRKHQKWLPGYGGSEVGCWYSD